MKIFEKNNTMTSKPCKPCGGDVENYFDDNFKEKEQEIKNGRR